MNESRPREVSPAERRAYLESRLERMPDAAAVLRAGKVWGEEGKGWENVAEHCLMQTVAAEIIADLIDLSPEKRAALIRNVAVHDWDKRIGKRPDDFLPGEIDAARKFYDEDYRPDYGLQAATSPEFYVEAYTKGEDAMPLLERLMCYIDDSTDESDFVSPKARLSALEKSGRWPGIRDTYDHQLGGQNFFHYAIGLEERFADVLLERINEVRSTGGRKPLSNAAAITELVREEIHARVREHAAHGATSA